jgi:hypothetical protein
VPEAVKFVPVQEVAFVELQVRVVGWPLVMEAGDAESEAVGAGMETTGAYAWRLLSATHPSTPDAKLRFHQV